MKKAFTFLAYTGAITMIAGGLFSWIAFPEARHGLAAEYNEVGIYIKRISISALGLVSLLILYFFLSHRYILNKARLQFHNILMAAGVLAFLITISALPQFRANPMLMAGSGFYISLIGSAIFSLAVLGKIWDLKKELKTHPSK